MSLKKYLIGIDDLELREAEVAIVLADNKESAIEKYIANIGIKNEFFLEDVYSPCVNMSYAESLFEDNYEEHIYNGYGYSRYSQEEIDEFFNDNVKNLFKGNDDWYKLYMSIFEYEDEKNEDGYLIPKTVTFPNEMLVHMFKNNESYMNELLCKEIGVEIKEII
ncbi:hypothetical protein ACQPUY_00535 [Clostridium nigeriense]|uniref:hypothetical protein n=1 Tax=Clostridium nigeriense TaxID=1805470 RepID=UPI003D34E806